MRKFATVDTVVAVLNRDDIDTDQIIPARFLKTTKRTGLGDHLFEDWRFGADRQPREDFVLNTPAASGAQVLLGGRNFGCGSSREHAVWALLDFGIRAVIAEGFADIFRKNSLRNGLLAISVDADTHRRVLPPALRGERFRIDLASQTVTPGQEAPFAFEVDPFSRVCMLDGVDELEYILRHNEHIQAFEAAR